MLIAVLSCFSFLPGQWVLRSDTLAAMFQYGPREALLFIALLLPLAAALSALLMAVAIRCRSFKEAQASTTIVVLVAVPAAAGERLRSRRRGALAPLGAGAGAEHADDAGAEGRRARRVSRCSMPLGVCAVLTVLGVWYVARRIVR